MHRSTSRTIASFFAGALVASTSMIASAQSIPSADLGVDQLRAAYLASGYQVDAPIKWWTPDRVSTFRVADPASDRVLMVFVYPDSATAGRDRAQAEARDPASATSGPHLVPGYGFSSWRQNVAVVQSTTSELDAEYADTQVRNDGMVREPARGVDTATDLPTYAVDLDLLNVVDANVVNL